MMKIDDLMITAAMPSDAPVLATLSEKTFKQAFARLNKKEDFERYLSDSFTENKIKSEIIDKDSLFFIAKLKDQFVGYAKICQSLPPRCVRVLPAIELSRLYALQQYWGYGVGPALMETCIAYACSNAFRSIWLGCWEKNDRGNAFYTKLNFEIVGSKTFAIGSDIQKDHIFTKRLI